MRWKHLKDEPFRIRKKVCPKNLQNAIKQIYCRIKELKTELNKALSEFENSTTLMKRALIKFFINHLISNKLIVVQLRHHEKLENLIIEKRIQDGIHNNPNEVITNLTDTNLYNYEIEILNYG